MPSTSSTINPTFIPPVPHNLLCTLIHPSDAVGQQSTEMNLMEYDNPVIIEQGEMMETDDNCEPMETERDIDLMETDDESDNDFESVRDSDIEFMNEDESEEHCLTFYRIAVYSLSRMLLSCKYVSYLCIYCAHLSSH